MGDLKTPVKGVEWHINGTLNEDDTHPFETIDHYGKPTFENLDTMTMYNDISFSPKLEVEFGSKLSGLKVEVDVDNYKKNTPTLFDSW